MKIVKIAAGVLFGSVIVALIGSLVGEIVATLPPFFPRSGANPLSTLGLPYEQVDFITPDGLVIRGWFVPTEESAAPAIVYAPGTGHDQRSGLHIVPALHAAGYHVLLFSYRGSGESEGNELGFTYGQSESIDLDAAVGFLRDVKDVDQVGVIGFSAGAATAILSAARNPGIDAVVAAAPFTSIDEIWHSNSPRILPDWFQDLTIRIAEIRKGFQRDNIEPINVIDQISPRQLLILHGGADSRVTMSQARRLYDSAQAPRELWVVEGATHRMMHEEALVTLSPGIISFLDGALQHSQAHRYAAHVPAS